MQASEEFLLKANKSLPATCISDSAIIEINADTKDFSTIIKELEHNPIPKSWIFGSEVLVSEIRSAFEIDHKAKFIVMICGKTKGKTTQVLFHSNRVLKEHPDVYIVDGDMGQQSLYMPSTVALAKLDKPIISFYELYYKEARFTGVTRAGNNNIFIQSIRIAELVNNVPKGSVVIVDTDGWIVDSGLAQKINLVDKIKPNFVFVLDTEDPKDFSMIMKGALDKRGIRYLLIPDDNQYYLARSQEERRQHRTLMYYRFFATSIDFKIQRSKIKIFKEFYNLKTQQIDRVDANLDQYPLREGTLCGLYDLEDQFLGLGYFLGVNKKEIWIRSSEIESNIAYIIIGRSWIEI